MDKIRNTDIDSLRKEIDATDKELVELFVHRMELSADIAQVKKKNGLPVYDAVREAELLARISALAGEYGGYTIELYKKILSLSRKYQEDMIQNG